MKLSIKSTLSGFFVIVALSTSAQEWSPYVPGQVSYYISEYGDQNYYGVRALDTMIERDTYKVYYFKSGVWPCQFQGPVDCSHVNPPDSMVYSNGTYRYSGSDAYIHPPEIRYYFDDSIGTTWHETDIPLNFNEYMDTVTFRIDSIFVDTLFGTLDSFKSISRNLPEASPLVVSKKFGLVKGDLRIPYREFDPEFGLPNSFFHMPDSLIGLKTNDTVLGELPPEALEFLPYQAGTRLKWSHFRYDPELHQSWESIDSITSVDTTSSELVLHHQTITATKDGLDTTNETTTYDRIFLNGIIRNHMNYYNLDCANASNLQGKKVDVLKKDTAHSKGYFKLEFFEINTTGYHHWVDTNCQFVPGIAIMEDVKFDGYEYNSRYGFRRNDYYSYHFGIAMGGSDILIAYQSATDTFGDFSVPEFELGIDDLVKKLKVKLYPNPASNSISISVPHVSAKVRYQVFSSHGRKIQQGAFFNQTTLDISSLPDGVYLIELVADDKSDTKKFIKQ